ncbi:uncharacterized protein LOC135184984 isoform X1 [Pogoniulus pusillus]|uniref:uncharacterized protein LOC135184984 isoform X1 n=1 Tax=Pogoniulus pusillus TaxID=488313 RepID=UPI0030B99BA7
MLWSQAVELFEMQFLLAAGSEMDFLWLWGQKCLCGAKKETFFTCFSCASSSVCLLRCFCLFLWQRSVCFFGWRADHPYYRRLECLQPAVFAARQTPGEDRGHAAVAPIVTPCDLSSCPGCLPVLGAGSEYVVRSAWGVPSFAVLTVGTPRAMEWAQAGDGLLQQSKRVLYEAKAAVMINQEQVRLKELCRKQESATCHPSPPDPNPRNPKQHLAQEVSRVAVSTSSPGILCFSQQHGVGYQQQSRLNL